MPAKMSVRACATIEPAAFPHLHSIISANRRSIAYVRIHAGAAHAFGWPMADEQLRAGLPRHAPERADRPRRRPGEPDGDAGGHAADRHSADAHAPRSRRRARYNTRAAPGAAAG